MKKTLNEQLEELRREKDLYRKRENNGMVKVLEEKIDKLISQIQKGKFIDLENTDESDETIDD